MKSLAIPAKKFRIAYWFCGVLIFFSALVLGGYWINRLQALSALEEATLRQMEQRASSLTTAVSEQTRGTLFNLDLALLHLSHLYGSQGRLSAEDVESVKSAAPPGLVRRVTVIDRTGTVTVTHPSGGEGLHLADRPHFKVHVSGRHRGLFIGEPIQSRVESAWVIPLSRPLLDRQGKFAGVIAIMVSPEYLSGIYARMAEGRDDVVALVLQDGAFLSRSRNLADHLGKPVRSDRPFIGANAPASGVFRSISSYEKVDRVFAFRRLSEWPLVVVVGLGVSDTLAPVRAGSDRDTQSAVAISLLVVVLVAGICLTVMRLERSLVQVRESDDRRAMAFAGADELAWEWDVKHRQLRFFGNCPVFFGGHESERLLAVDDWLPLVHPEERQLVFVRSSEFLSDSKGSMELRFRLQVANGQFRWVLVRGQKLALDPAGRVTRALGILMDIDAEHRAQIEAAQTREAYQRLIESAGEGIFVVNAKGLIELFNPAAEHLLGWPNDEICGQNAHQLLHPMVNQSPFDGDHHCPVCDTLRDQQTRRAVRLSYRHRDGRTIPVDVSVSPLILNGELTGAVVVVTDISQRLAYEAELERLARTDGLTGLWNRRYFVEQIERELLRARRDGEPLTLLMLDLDHFKGINDRYGHAAGDIVLVALSRLFNTQLREVDIVGRLGGEEFAVGLPGIDLKEAVGVAERLRTEIAALAVQAGDDLLSFTVSIGVAGWDRRETFDHLLARADAALYDAKDSGRNRVVSRQPVATAG